jgi:hypothetical protein
MRKRLPLTRKVDGRERALTESIGHWADERAPKQFGNANSAGESRTERLGGSTAQSRRLAIISSFKRTPDKREGGGLLSKMLGSQPKIVRPTAN